MNVIPPGRKSSGGWYTFDCPACGDRRGRGGFLVTPTGGFRYHCFNAGCIFQEQPTGWEPDRGLGGRPRQLYSLLGGNIKDLPIDLIMRRADEYGKSGGLVEKNEVHPTWNFPEESLPAGCQLLTDFVDNTDYMDVFEYAQDRLGNIIYEYPLMWTSKHSRSIIVPYIHFGKIVGWMSRAIDGKAFFQKCHSDYVFNQEELVGEGRAAIIIEGVFDALSLRGFAIRQATPNPQQTVLFNSSGRDIIAVPDFASDGMGLIDVAEKNGWWISTPDWDLQIKDATQAVKHYGRLYTIRSVMRTKHKNYLSARIRANAGSASRGLKWK